MTPAGSGPISPPRRSRKSTARPADSTPAAGLHPDQEAPHRQQPDHTEHEIHAGLDKVRPPLDPLRGPHHRQRVDRQAQEQGEYAERYPQRRLVAHQNGPSTLVGVTMALRRMSCSSVGSSGTSCTSQAMPMAMV